MRIGCLLLVRDEEWIIRVSSLAASRWCDELHMIAHHCTDRTAELAAEPWRAAGKPVHARTIGQEGSLWKEMDLRQMLLESARKTGCTHMAMVDADEIPTANVLPQLRLWCGSLEAGMVLDAPMIPMRSLDRYQDDGSVWTRSWLSVAFMDRPGLSWKPDAQGYQHHNRCPYGVEKRRRVMYYPTVDRRSEGGIFHMQFAPERRLRAKHCLYAMADHLNFPNRRSYERLNTMYGEALKCDNTSPAPEAWWEGYRREDIALDHVPWHEVEIRRLLEAHGRKAFEGLDLRGY